MMPHPSLFKVITYILNTQSLEHPIALWDVYTQSLEHPIAL